MDSGSELSYVSDETARLFPRQRVATGPMEGYAHLADGTQVAILGILHLSLRLQGRTYRHRFAILPRLGSQVLIGVDLWRKLRLTLRPPPLGPGSKRTTIGALSRQTPREAARLQAFLAAELPKFERIRGTTSHAEHRIRLKPGPPIKQRYRPRNPAMQAVIDREVDKMLAEGVIEPSRSPWSSPVVLVKKKDGAHRFCIDFRRLNEVSEKDAYPLPHITATLDKLRGATYLSTLDLKSGYWQVPLARASRPATAFTVPGRGLYQFTLPSCRSGSTPPRPRFRDCSTLS